MLTALALSDLLFAITILVADATTSPDRDGATQCNYLGYIDLFAETMASLWAVAIAFEIGGGLCARRTTIGGSSSRSRSSSRARRFGSTTNSRSGGLGGISSLSLPPHGELFLETKCEARRRLAARRCCRCLRARPRLLVVDSFLLALGVGHIIALHFLSGMAGGYLTFPKGWTSPCYEELPAPNPGHLLTVKPWCRGNLGQFIRFFGTWNMRVTTNQTVVVARQGLGRPPGEFDQVHHVALFFSLCMRGTYLVLPTELATNFVLYNYDYGYA